MINDRLQIAIETEKEILDRLNRINLLPKVKRDIFLDYAERQVSNDLYLYEYLKESKDISILIRLEILKKLTDRNFISLSYLKDNRKVYGKQKF